MMTLWKIREVEKEASNFIKACQAAERRLVDIGADKHGLENLRTISSKETGALRRESMNLTRALSRLRSFE